ncbi:hypothetical protein DSLASN_05600 [Desulfoluna limicola]|uniref:Uncharacterized protein n=1 Tax=Desulfoluna limicola TaxID=2810562 RepID=A0ABM7PCI8_9BACT|nr:hypothetical protein [Desulfoluna limicola]BCS94928.1 hypothetical protein DSLASN_05600 [Desulfoluna limicola]
MSTRSLFDYSSEELAEKKIPKERFVQALDQYELKGQFRSFLESHCAENWRDIFPNIDSLEDAIKSAGSKTTVKEQSCAFFEIFFKHSHFHTTLLSYAEMDELPPHRLSKIQLFKAAASNLFPDDPIGFHKCFPDNDSYLCDEYRFLVRCASFFYDQDICLNNKFIKTLAPTQISYLFDALFPFEFYDPEPWFPGHGIPNNVESIDDSLWNNFCDLRSVKLLKKYLKSEVEHTSHDELLDWLNNLPVMFERKIGMLYPPILKSPEIDHYIDRLYLLFRKLCRDLEFIWCKNVNPIEMPENIKHHWGDLYHQKGLPLVPGQPIDRIQNIIEWSLGRDLQKWGNQEILDRLFYKLDLNFWLISPYNEIWKSAFDKAVDSLTIEKKLAVLSRSFPSVGSIYASCIPAKFVIPETASTEGEGIAERLSYMIPDDYAKSHRDLFKRTLEGSEVTKELYVDAVITSMDYYSGEDFVPYVDKCLGLIRGVLSSGKKEYIDGSTKRLLDFIKHYAPEKAIRHWLLMLRANPAPCSDISLDFDNSDALRLSVGEFAAQHRPVNAGPMDKVNADITEMYEEKSLWVAEFCLSRLQLRKKQKAGSGGYHNKQIKERSPYWRQAYLRALSELKTDLGGKVHKTAHFIRKNDPDEDVRAVAAQCYKASRRNRNTVKTGIGIKRSVKAAYWWMLLAQRKELGLEVDDDAALKTRRRLLR